MSSDRPLALAALGVLLAVALLGQFLPARTPEAVADRQTLIEVVSGEDVGPGTLRNAIVQASRTEGRPTIVLRVDVDGLQTPLPAVVHPRGFDIVGGRDGAPVEIDASGLVHGPVLALASPGAELRDLAIRGAPDAAIEVRGSGTRVASVGISHGNVGIRVVEGVDALTVEGSTFVENEVGIDATSAGRDWHLRNNRFEGHREAGIRLRRSEGEVVAGAPVTMRGNRFEGDRISILAARQSTRIEDNEVAGAAELGIYLSGARTTVAGNRVRQAQRAGIVVHGIEGGSIVDNEIDHNGVGVLVNGSSAAVVERNRIHENSAGIVHVFGAAGAPNRLVGNTVLTSRFDGITVVGSSPLLRGNRILGSGAAGVRVQTWVGRDGSRIAAEPVLEDNVVEAAGGNPLVRDEYVEPAEEDAR